MKQELIKSYDHNEVFTNPPDVSVFIRISPNPKLLSLITGQTSVEDFVNELFKPESRK